MKPKKFDPSVNIIQKTLSSSSHNKVLKRLSHNLSHQAKAELLTVATLNPEQVVQAHHDDSFRSILNGFSIVVADGIGITWATQFLYQTKIDRIQGVELAEELIRESSQRGYSVYFLGARLNPQQQKAMIQDHFQAESNNLSWTYDSGITNIHDTKSWNQESKEILSRIKKNRPQLLLVALGAPWQEQWIEQNRVALENSGVKVAMVVGGAFDYWSGKVQRAPSWIVSLGLEWLFRLVQEPWRWRRQLRLISFVQLVLKNKFLAKKSIS